MVENGRGWWHFSSPKEASYIASSITFFYPSLSSLYLFRCRSAYWDAIVASPENTRCAWKRVKRSSSLNGEQKNLLSRFRDANSCILTFYSRSALDPSKGERDSTSRWYGRRRSADLEIERFEKLKPIYFIFQASFTI